MRRANRRIVENEGAKWLVVLERSPMPHSAPFASGNALTAQSRREERVRKRLETAADRNVPQRSSSARQN